MTFISYAQNFEDIMLWRALKDVSRGFYIDIGAAWPDEHSVTKAFYDMGWRGINVEPNSQFHQQLEYRRPRDTNLREAISDHEGVVVMHILQNTGLSTIDDAIAHRHQQAGWEVERQQVQVTTLAALWAQHVPSEQEVHFLKIDIEGLEEAALRGNDWVNNRPWTLVVEATLPLSQVESHQTWEPLLIDVGYQFAYADGLNRFYVAKEHAELLAAFRFPPNDFDGFVLHSQRAAEERAQQAEEKAQQAEEKAQQAEEKAQQAEEKAQQTGEKAQQAQEKTQQAETAASQHLAQLQAVYASMSWRVTSPLRWLAAPIMSWGGTIATTPASTFTNRLIRWAMARPRLVSFTHRCLRRFPTFRNVITRRVAVATSFPCPPEEMLSSRPRQPSPRAHQIFNDLKAATDQNPNGDQ